MRIIKKIFVFSLIAVFLIVGLTQVLLNNQEIKSKISRLYEIESRYVYSEKNIPDGYIKIKVSHPSDNLFLLQNGERISILNKNETKINILDNSVIEIDGRGLDNQIYVEVIEMSENIDAFYEKNINVNSNIVILGRFFIK